MGFFGGSTKLSTSTTTENTDARTLAEAGGVAAQYVGGNLTFEDVSDEAIEVAGDALLAASSLSQSATDHVADISGKALDLFAASKGTQPVNPVLIIAAIGIALWLAKLGK